MDPTEAAFDQKPQSGDCRRTAIVSCPFHSGDSNRRSSRGSNSYATCIYFISPHLLAVGDVLQRSPDRRFAADGAMAVGCDLAIGETQGNTGLRRNRVARNVEVGTARGRWLAAISARRRPETRFRASPAAPRKAIAGGSEYNLTPNEGWSTLWPAREFNVNLHARRGTVQ